MEGSRYLELAERIISARGIPLTGTQIIEFVRHGDFNSGVSIVTYGGSTSYLDSPATTSATTYKVQFKVHTNGGSQNVFLNSSTGTITLMEIAQ